MKWIRDRKNEGHPERAPREARQARYGKPIFFVLIGGIAGLIIAYLIVAGIFVVRGAGWRRSLKAN